MKIDKKDINVFLALWIKSDPELWGELRDIQIKILLQRIVKEMSYADLAREHKVEEDKLRLIFKAILKKIELSLGKEVAYHLKKMDNMLDGRIKPTIELDFDRIYLN